MKKHLWYLICLGILVVILVGCSGNNRKGQANRSKKELTFGFYIGPYREHFTEGIQPILESSGYKITFKDFTDPVAIAKALQEGEIDGSFSMSIAYAEGFNQDHGSNFVRGTYTTSAPQAIYSKKHTSLEEVKDKMVIGVPNDPVNEERAFRILEKIGWVQISEDAKTIDFSMNNSIKPQKYDLTYKEIDSPQLATSLPDVDYAIINGNIAIDAGYNIGQDSVFVEDTPKQHRLTMTVNKENEKSQWVKEIRDAYLSGEFKTYFDKNLKKDGFLAPISNEN